MRVLLIIKVINETVNTTITASLKLDKYVLIINGIKAFTKYGIPQLDFAEISLCFSCHCL